MAQIVYNAQAIAPKQIVSQWARSRFQFDLNIWTFEVMVGKAAVGIFQASFDMKRFNTSKSVAWARRSPKSKKTHPLMVETGSLKNSIKWRRIKDDSSTGVQIYTDPDGFSNTSRHKGFCYAAVHNDPNSAGTRTGRVANMPRRQFIGHSTELSDKLKELSSVIFHMFPK